MADLNLPELQRLVRELEQARSGHKTAQRLVDALTRPADFTSVMLTLTVKNEERNSREEAVNFDVPLTETGTYQPKPRAVEANRQMLLAARRHAQERLIGWASKVEGLEFQIRRLTK